MDLVKRRKNTYINMSYIKDTLRHGMPDYNVIRNGITYTVFIRVITDIGLHKDGALHSAMSSQLVGYEKA